ncbi:hypothetical protein Tco_0435362 [Tanacetum coccineum]
MKTGTRTKRLNSFRDREWYIPAVPCADNGTHGTGTCNSSNVERHSRSGVEITVKARSQFKKRSIPTNVEIEVLPQSLAGMLSLKYKEQKVVGAFPDQSIEQRNDVTAVSGVNLKVNKEEDDKMRTTAANVAARAGVGGDDMLS